MEPTVGNKVGAAAQSKEVKVYDLINAGPHHRFTVSGLLVSNCLLIDFVGNSGKHKLMSAADILGGKVSDKAVAQVIAKAKKDGGAIRVDAALNEEEQRIKDAIESARKLGQDRRSKLVAKVRFSKKSINPFDTFDIQPVKQRGWDSNRTLSEKQSGLLMKQGINPDELSYAESRQVIGEIFRRWDQKLCTAKQAALLKRYGYDTKNMKMDKASELITTIRNRGWQKPEAASEPEPVHTTPAEAYEERSPF
jgi:hypothetical protein